MHHENINCTVRLPVSMYMKVKVYSVAGGDVEAAFKANFQVKKFPNLRSCTVSHGECIMRISNVPSSYL